MSHDLPADPAAAAAAEPHAALAAPHTSPNGGAAACDIPVADLAGLNLLFRVVNQMHASLDPERIARITLTAMTAGPAVGMNRAAVLRVDPEADLLRGYGAVGPATRDEASEIWARLDRESASLEELMRRATGDAAAARDAILGRRVCALSYPLGSLREGPLARALEGQGSVFDSAHPLPEGLREIFDGTAGFVVPLRSVDRILGVVVADRFDDAALQAAEEKLGLATEVAHQAGLALGNAEQFGEVGVRAAQLSTLHELGKGFLATVDLTRHLQLVARAAAEVTNARTSVVWLAGEDGLTVGAHWSARGQESCSGVPASLTDLARQCLQAGELQRPVSALCAPLRAYGRAVGALAVSGRIARDGFELPAFDRHDRQFLLTLSDQAAIAIENLRLVTRFRQTELRLRETQAVLLRNEKLAALGEMSAKVAHEIRNPLTAIGGFARRVARAMGQNDPNREHVELIVRETERLERILSEQLQFAQLARPRLRMADLNAVLVETLQLVGETVVERRVRLIRRLAPEIPKLLLDADKIKQVLLNILQNALQNVSQGGRVKVETRLVQGSVEIDVANDGPKIAGEVMERLFVPFSTARENGTGLGLAVADQIVREHGGEIRVRSDRDWGCVFSVVLPIKQNEDRRTQSGDRRDRTRPDRRGNWA